MSFPMPIKDENKDILPELTSSIKPNDLPELTDPVRSDDFELPQLGQVEETVNNDETILKETGIVLSTASKKIVAVVKVADIEIIGINPRFTLNEKALNELAEKETESLVPVQLGYVKEDLMFKGQNIKGKLFMVDGHHRIESRKLGGYELIKAFITEYTDSKDFIRDAFVMNANHGTRLTIEEVQWMANLIIEEQLSLDPSDRTPILKLSETYMIDRAALSNARTRLNIFNALKSCEDKDIISTFERIPVSAFKAMTGLETASQIEVRTFFQNFLTLLNSANTKREIMKKIRDSIQLFLEGKITTYFEYNEAERSEKTEDGMDDVFNLTRAEENLSLKNITTSDKEQIIENAIKKTDKVHNFSISLYIDTILKDAQTKTENLESILTNKNYSIDKSKDVLTASLEKLRESKRYLEQMEILIEQKLK